MLRCKLKEEYELEYEFCKGRLYVGLVIVGRDTRSLDLAQVYLKGPETLNDVHLARP